MNDEGDELLNIYLNISTACRWWPAQQKQEERDRKGLEARREGQRGPRSKERGTERADRMTSAISYTINHSTNCQNRDLMHKKQKEREAKSVGKKLKLTRWTKSRKVEKIEIPVWSIVRSIRTKAQRGVKWWHSLCRRCVRVPKRTVLYVPYTQQHTAHSTQHRQTETLWWCDDAMLLEDKEQRGLRVCYLKLLIAALVWL